LIALALALALTAPAHACGGFFCDNVDPVVQQGERILFRQDGPEMWTTFVEVQFEGPPSEFAWVVPITVEIDPETQITVAPAGLFDELEDLTAPRFIEESDLSSADMAVADMEMGGADCGCRGVNLFGTEMYSYDYDYTLPDTSGVDVVGAAVVGPYDIEVITAEDSDNLVNWLQMNGYQMPRAAEAPLAHYIDRGYAFLGLKLIADVPEGPIDTLVLECGGSEPSIPLELTAVAAVPDMEITAYVLADERYVPENFAELAFDYDRVQFTFDGDTDYEPLLIHAIDGEEGGLAWNTEFAAPASEVLDELTWSTRDALDHGGYFTRFHTFVSPEEMLLDPTFSPDPEAPDLGNLHVVHSSTAAVAPLALGALCLLGAVARRRS